MRPSRGSECRANQNGTPRESVLPARQPVPPAPAGNRGGSGSSRETGHSGRRTHNEGPRPPGCTRRTPGERAPPALETAPSQPPPLAEGMPSPDTSPLALNSESIPPHWTARPAAQHPARIRDPSGLVRFGVHSLPPGNCALCRRRGGVLDLGCAGRAQRSLVQ